MDAKTVRLIESWLYGRPRSTQKTYLSAIERALKWMGKPFERVDLLDLQAYQSELFHHRRLRTNTVVSQMRAIASFFAFAVEEGYIEVNPCRNLRVPKRTQAINERILSKPQIQAIITSATTARDEALLAFLYGTGCRVSEAVGVLWKDFSELPDGRALVRLLGKGDKWRSVHVPKVVWERIAALRGDAADDAKVFDLKVRRAQQVVKDAVDRAKAPKDASAHWFRHSNASHAIEAGAPLPVVRDSLGHSNISVTNVYAHSNPEQSSSDFLNLDL